MAEFPSFIEPMKATLVSSLPEQEKDFAYEFKWDGYRALAYWDGKKLRFLSRNAIDFSEWYPELQGLKKQLKHPAILDGEIVALDRKGSPDFQSLQQRSGIRTDQETAQRMKNWPVHFYLFDLVYDRSLILKSSYLERRERLARLKLNGDHWQTTPFELNKFESMSETAQKHGIEGIIAKRVQSSYEPGRRAKSWLKKKFIRRQELVVGGWSRGLGQYENALGSLILGFYDHGKLKYAGHVGSGFSHAERFQIHELLAQYAIRQSPFADKIPNTAKAQFIRPIVVAEIEFTEWTGDNKLRHPVFKGFRFDKSPKEVVLEKAA